MRIDYHLPHFSLLASSRRRSLTQHLAKALKQQMYFWGQDVRSSLGNLLETFGMERIERTEHSNWKGTSRYQQSWQSGLIELHGFCAGWYPLSADAPGIVFVRGSGRFQLCCGQEPASPGEYPKLPAANADQLLATTLPFASWLLAYESWIAATQPTGYRQRCFQQYQSLPSAQAWLEPASGLRWLELYVHAPEQLTSWQKKAPLPASNFWPRAQGPLSNRRLIS